MRRTLHERCSFLIALLALMLTENAAAEHDKLQPPERGFISSEPAKTWEQGLISGNDTLPANERITIEIAMN